MLGGIPQNRRPRPPNSRVMTHTAIVERAKVQSLQVMILAKTDPGKTSRKPFHRRVCRSGGRDQGSCLTNIRSARAA